MKVKKANSNEVLKNNIVKHIVLEAPTVNELEKKLKKYETILVRALTSLYRISEMTLDRGNFYHITQKGSYQVAIDFHFFGVNRQHIISPQHTVKDLEQLTILESGKKHESPLVVSAHLLHIKEPGAGEIKFETDSIDKLEEIICSRQRQEIENIASKKNLEEISFYPPHKQVDPKTGKISVSMKYKYLTRDLDKSLTQSPSNHDEPDEK